MSRKILSLTLSFSLLFQYSGFAQSINLADYLSQGHNVVALDRFRPLALRYFSYEPSVDNFKILLDKGDQKNLSDTKIKDEADKLLTYFKIGLTLPNEKFWVNLRPDAADQIIDPELEKTDLGKVLLESDLQLKKDTSSLTSPQSKEGKIYWDKLYKKVGELFGTENITIPTITRPWIVPGEIIVRESKDSAYIYKAVLKVMLEEDQQYAFSDPRLKELNKYSTELIRETILPELTKRINSSKDYANLRQVYFSLILARWFKDSFSNSGSVSAPGARAPENSYVKLINSQDLTNLTSKNAWSKTAYFNEYKKSFKDGEYNLSEKVHTPTGQAIRRYTSGGMLDLMNGKRHSYNPGIANSSIAAHRNMVEIEGAGNLKVGSPIEKYRDDLKSILSELRDKGGLIPEYEYNGINDILNNPNTKPDLLLLILNYLKDVRDDMLPYFDKNEADPRAQLTPKLDEIYNSQEMKNVFSPTERIKQARQTVKEILNRNKVELSETYIQEAQTMIERWDVVSLFKMVTELRHALNNMYVEMPEDRVILTLVINDLKKIIYDKKTEKISDSPLVEAKELAEGLRGKLNKDGKDGVNLFDLIENAFEGKENEPGRAGHQRVVKFRTDINIAGVACKTFEVSRYQQTIKGNDVKYRTIEFFADEFSSEYVLQIKVYNDGDGRVEALSPETISEDERIIVTAVIRKIFKAESLMVMDTLFKKTGLNSTMIENSIYNRSKARLGAEIVIGNGVEGYSSFVNIKIGEGVDKYFLKRIDVIKGLTQGRIILYNSSVSDNDSLSIYTDDKNGFTLAASGKTRDIAKMEDAYKIQTDIVERVMTGLGVHDSSAYLQFRDEFLKALNSVKSGSPLVEDEKLAQDLQGVTFGLIEKEFKNVEMARNVQSIINIGDNYYRLKFSAANSVPLGKAPKDYKSEDQYKIIELFSSLFPYDSNVELVLQIKVYKSGYISAFVSKDLNADERTIIAAVIRQSFQAEYLIVLEDLFEKAGLNPEMVKTALGNTDLGWEDESMEYGDFNEHRDISWGRQINPLTINFETMSNGFSLSKIEINDTLPRKGYKIILLNPNDYQARLSISLYENGPMAFGFWEMFKDLSKSNNSYQIQNNIVETVMESLGVKISPKYFEFRDKLIKALTAVKSSSAMEGNNKWAEEFNRFDQRLKSGDEKVLDEIVNFYNGITNDNVKKWEFYKWLQNNQSALAAKVMPRIGLCWEGIVPELTAVVKGESGYGNPYAAARQLHELYFQETIGGLKAPREVVEEAKNVWRKYGQEFMGYVYPVYAFLNAKFPIVGEGKKPGKLVIVRHGETSWSDSVFNKWAGWLNSLITDKGRNEARKAGEQFKEFHFDLAYSSDLSRAKDTLSEFLKGSQQEGIIIKDVPALREKSYGALAGWSRTDAQKTFGDDLYNLYRRAPKGRAPLGENFEDTKERVGRDFLEEILPAIAAGKNVVIAAHGNSLRSLLVILKEHTSAKMLSDKEIEKLEVHLSVPIAISFDNKLNHEEMWSNQHSPEEVLAFLQAGSPLTVEDLKKIEWKNVLFNSLREIFEERFRGINEYHGKLFVMEKLLGQFIMARYDKDKIRVIKDAIEAARLYWEAPSEIEEANRKELRVFLTESLDSYCQKILSEIKEAFSDSKLKFLSNDVSTATADRKKKRDFLLKQINEIEAYYFGKEDASTDYRNRNKFVMPGKLNWAIRVHKMIQDEVPLNNILEQSVPSTSSAMMSEDLTGGTPKKIVGGIDFRQMNMLIQPQGGFASSSLDFSLPALSKAEIEAFDLDKELELIQRMASSGIDPIDERLKKYLAVCFARGKTGKEIDELKLCLEDVFIAQQLDARETPDGYKEVIVIADTRKFVLKESRLAAGKSNVINLN